MDKLKNAMAVILCTSLLMSFSACSMLNKGDTSATTNSVESRSSATEPDEDTTNSSTNTSENTTESNSDLQEPSIDSYDTLLNYYNSIVAEKGKFPFDAIQRYSYDGNDASLENWYVESGVVSGYIDDFGNDGQKDLLVVYEEPATGSEKTIKGVSQGEDNYSDKTNTKLKATVYTCANNKIETVRDFTICSISTYSGNYETFITQKDDKTYLCTQLAGAKIPMGAYWGWYIYELSSSYDEDTADDVLLFTPLTLDYSINKIQNGECSTLGHLYDNYSNLQTSTAEALTTEFSSRGVTFDISQLTVEKTGATDISKISIPSYEYGNNYISVSHTDYIHLGDDNENAQNSESDETSIFESMPEGFVFCSGAGGWSTTLNLENDGTFTGEYSDWNPDSGDGYTKGIVYICNFSGKFSEPKKVDEYTYSMKLESLDLEKEPGEVYYENDMKYICSEPYGFDDADEFLIYLPGSPIESLPEGFLSWAHVDVNTTDTLPYYGIYNKGGEQGFVGSSS